MEFYKVGSKLVHKQDPSMIYMIADFRPFMAVCEYLIFGLSDYRQARWEPHPEVERLFTVASGSDLEVLLEAARVRIEQLENMVIQRSRKNED